jgi:hypothetical protein
MQRLCRTDPWRFPANRWLMRNELRTRSVARGMSRLHTPRGEKETLGWAANNGGSMFRANTRCHRNSPEESGLIPHTQRLKLSDA